MDQAIELTLEQEFSFRTFTDLVQEMSLEQVQNLLVEQHRVMMIRETMYQELLRHDWKLDLDFAAL